MTLTEKISVYSSWLEGAFVITADYTFRAVYVSNLTLNFAYLLACTTYEFTTVGKSI